MAIGTKAREQISRLIGRAGGRFDNFDNSRSFWQERYERRGTSGAGSFGRLAQAKADFLNSFVAERGIRSVLEMGCGDGNQLALANYPYFVGADVAPAAIATCRARFAADPTKRFIVAGEESLPTCDLAISLDVIYHLVEDDVFDRYMEDLLAHSSKFVVLYTSDSDVWVPDRIEPAHIRHRPIQRWMTGQDRWNFLERIRNQYPWKAEDQDNTSFADFYIYERTQ